MEHEGAKFVFVQTGPKTYRRADVKRASSPTSGSRSSRAKAGEPVVVEGAMAIKSEMLVPTLTKED